MPKLLHAAIAGLLAGAATYALAQPGPGGGPMIHATRAEAVAAADRRFDRLDADHDGVVTRAEFEAAHGAPPPADEKAHAGMRHGVGMGPRWFERLDPDGDSRVSRAEVEAQAGATFDRLDTDHDGTLSPEERQAMRRWRGGGRPTE